MKQTEVDLTEDNEVLEPNHTHYLLLDNGQLSGYLSDGQRAQFVDAATKDGDCKRKNSVSLFLFLRND